MAQERRAARLAAKVQTGEEAGESKEARASLDTQNSGNADAADDTVKAGVVQKVEEAEAEDSERAVFIQAAKGVKDTQEADEGMSEVKP